MCEVNHENTVALRGVSESRLFTHVAKRGDALWSRGERNLLKTSRLVFPNFMMLLKWPRGERNLLKSREAVFFYFYDAAEVLASNTSRIVRDVILYCNISA